jgi:hypothetical protein
MGIQYVGTGRQGTVQNVAYSATAGTITNVIGSQTYKIRVLTTTDAWIVIGNNPTATVATGTYLPAKAAEYFTCTPGQKVSAIQDTAGGTLNVTEVS